MDFFEMTLIGIIAGWLAGQFMPGKGFGVFGDIIAGILGALAGGLLIERTGLFSGSSLVGSLLVATSGAIIFLYGLRMFKKA